jgi:Protein of unknown function (DUF1569)
MLNCNLGVLSWPLCFTLPQEGKVPPMHAVLERVVCEIDGQVRGLNAETSQLHPKGLTYKWNAQQVVEHLVLGYRLTSSTLQKRLDKKRVSRKQTRTYLQWSLQLMMLSFGVFPGGAPALDETTPVKGRFAPMDGRQLADLLRQEIEAMDTLLDSCRRKFGMERVATHPFLGPLRVDQWRRFHALHGLHHVAQLRSVIAEVAPVPSPRKMNGTLVKELPIHHPSL